MELIHDTSVQNFIYILHRPTEANTSYHVNQYFFSFPVSAQIQGWWMLLQKPLISKTFLSYFIDLGLLFFSSYVHVAFSIFSQSCVTGFFFVRLRKRQSTDCFFNKWHLNVSSWYLKWKTWSSYIFQKSKSLLITFC